MTNTTTTNHNNDNNTGTWIGDGGVFGSFSVDDDDDGRVTAESTKPGTPFHLRRSESFSIDDRSFFFSVRLLEKSGSPGSGGRVSVGLVSSPDGFRPGWKIRGMFYNGNVHNGIGCQISGFGRSPRHAGDEVAVAVRRRRRRAVRTTDDDCDYDDCDDDDVVLEVEFFLNGESLGTAYRLEDPDQTGQTYHPCVTVSGGGGKVAFVYRDGEEAAEATAKLLGSRERRRGFEGTWRIDGLSIGEDGSSVAIPPDPPMTVALNHRREPTAISVKVCNRFGISVRTTAMTAADGENDDDEEEEDTRTTRRVVVVVLGEGSTTRMLPPPSLREIEAAVFRAASATTAMTLLERDDDDEDRLRMTGTDDDGAPVLLTARRYTETFRPVTRY